jgi:hypothetical protein
MFEEVGRDRHFLGAASPGSAAWAERVLDRDLYVIELFESLVERDYNLDFAAALDARLD